jgi:hypothetical protein
VTRLDHRSRPLTARWTQPSKLGLPDSHHQRKQRDEPQESRSCQVRGDPGTNRVQTTSPNTSQHQPTFPQLTGPLDHQSPGSAFFQRRYISKRSTAQTKHALAGRAGLQDDRPPARAGLGRCGQGGMPHGSQRARSSVVITRQNRITTPNTPTREPTQPKREKIRPPDVGLTLGTEALPRLSAPRSCRLHAVRRRRAVTNDDNHRALSTQVNGGAPGPCRGRARPWIRSDG